jgi:hypothetical protein
MKLLRKIRIEGFRSIREADIELDADLTAFAGLAVQKNMASYFTCGQSVLLPGTQAVEARWKQ